MKKLLLGSASLCLFSISIVIFQMSCKKDATAQTSNSNYILPAATTSSLGGVIVGSGLSVTGNGTLSVNSSAAPLNVVLYQKDVSGSFQTLWLCNLDGSNRHQLPITLPSGYGITNGATITPDKTKIIFGASNSTTTTMRIYSCNLDGSNVTVIVDEGANNYYSINGAF